MNLQRNKNGQIEIAIPKKTNWFVTIFLGFWILLWIIAMTTIAYGLITTPSRIEDLIFIWIFFFLAGLFCIHIFFWQVLGTEILVIDNENLVVRKRGALINFSKRIEKKIIDNVSYDDDKHTPGWIKFWGLGGGKLIVEYLGRRIRLGQNLTGEEAEKLCEQLKQILVK